MTPLRILQIYPETISDGYGIRYAIYFAGCAHRCPGCHNPQSHDPLQGTVLTDACAERICREIRSNPLLDGITLSGGDPFYNPLALLALLQRLKADTGLNIWCYTGYTYEALLDDEARRPCLDYIDTLVDGPFVQSLFDPTLVFRGSRNQRILHLSRAR